MRYNPRERRAVSSIVGSIFFVLIMVVSIASLVTIFNSFSSYNSTVNKAGGSQVQQQETQLSITGDSFGSFPPTTTSNFNVAASCTATTATQPTNQNKLFFAVTMWWDFFTCNSNFQYSTSYDGVTWGTATTIPNLVSGYTVGPYFDIQISGSTIFLVIARVSSPHFQFGEGTLAAGGPSSAPAGTITWTGAPAEITTTANALGPIQIAEDSSGNEWVAVVQGATAIAIYEHAACATGSSTGWETSSFSCTSSAAPTNYAPTSTPNLGSLSANANMMLLAPPSALATTGAILVYETGSATTPSTGTIGIITQNALQTATWNPPVTPTGLSDYSLSSSSAVFIANTLYFAGLASGSTGAQTCTSAPLCTLNFWTLPFTSITSAGASVTEQVIESSHQSWMAALTTTGGTLALFDSYPTDTVVQYYTSSTLGSSGLWSAAISLAASETSVNGLSPASGAFAVTWSNTANNVRFAALSTLTLTNGGPFGVHVVDLYVQETANNVLRAHYYSNSTNDLDYWVGQGSSVSIPVRFVWTGGTAYMFTIGTDTGLTAQLTATSPPVATVTCPAGFFPSYQIGPSQTCSSVPAAESPATSFTSNANTCTDTTSGTARMMGLGVTYTTNPLSDGSVYVVLTFDDKSPAVSNVNSKWELAYGTGTAPACNAAATGTLTAQQYTVNTEAAVVLETGQSVGATITGLSANTAYWFDVQALDSSTDAWTYSLPSLSVTDFLTSGLTEPQVGYSSNTNTCTISSASTLMAGLGTTYTTGGAGFAGDVHLTLSVDVKSPATSAINSQWRVAYGTGTAPACGAASTGTTVGNQYQVATEAAVVLEMGQSESVVIPNLARSTTYWFDVQVTDSSAASWIYSNPTIAVAETTAAQNLPPNLAFDSGTTSCARNTAANAMAGFGTAVTYTTLSSSTGSIFGALTFKVASPATSNLNSKWQVVYGAGTAPACNAAAAGTTVGRQYTINTEAAVAGGMGQTIGFAITGLSPGTQYWFDVQATDSTNAVWTYSNPALSIMDIMPADFIHDFVAFSSNTNTCSRNTNTNLMTGFGIAYATTTIGSGNIQVVLTFNLLTPNKNGPTSQFQVAYGTGTAPACNAASTGTTVGNVFTGQNNAGAPISSAQSIGFTLVGLTPGTTYWFDLRALDSTADVWVYSNPQITVVELP